MINYKIRQSIRLDKQSPKKIKQPSYEIQQFSGIIKTNKSVDQIRVSANESELDKQREKIKALTRNLTKESLNNSGDTGGPHKYRAQMSMHHSVDKSLVKIHGSNKNDTNEDMQTSMSFLNNVQTIK